MTERAPLLGDCKICVACSNAIEEDAVMQVRVYNPTYYTLSELTRLFDLVGHPNHRTRRRGSHPRRPRAFPTRRAVHTHHIIDG